MILFNKINIDVAKILQYTLRVIKSYEFRTFAFCIIVSIAMCYGLKQIEIHGTRLANKYNKGFVK